MKSTINFLSRWAVSILGGLATGKELWKVQMPNSIES